MGLLEFKNISFSYGDTKALSRLSFSIPNNCVVGLVGSNGAGKTTAIKGIIRYLNPDEGEILYKGKDITKICESEYKISYIPDSPIFYEELTVLEHFLFIGTMYKTENMINDIIKVLNLEEHLNKIPIALSKGTAQKLSIGCALLRPHELLIADEPFSGLDPKQITTLKKIVAEEKNAGRTVIMSTHLLEIIENICDYYVFIEKGELIREGTRYELLEGEDCKKLNELYLQITKNEND